MNGAGVSLRPSLLRIHGEDLVGGATAALLSKGCLEVVLVFCRLGAGEGRLARTWHSSLRGLGLL